MAEQKQLVIGKLYMQESEFKMEGTKVFKTLAKEMEKNKDKPDTEIKPDNKLELKIETEKMEDDNLHEVKLTLNFIAKHKEQEIYHAKVVQAGIFQAMHYETDELESILNTYCAYLLYPYARQVISEQIQQGGFMSAPLPPINFDELYKQKKAKAEKMTETVAIEENN